jgi:hypothetical protein
MRSSRTNPLSPRRSGHAARPWLAQKISGLENTLAVLRSLEARHRAAGETEDADYFAEAIARRERELKALEANLARP